MIAGATLLVVCVGNVCRSPMAEALLRARLPGVDVQSAGIGALDGRPADPHAVALMRERGLDIGAHRARQLPSWLALRAGLILTADLDQKHWLERRHPSLCGRVYRLGDGGRSLDAMRRGFDVPDPYLGPRASFAHSLWLIERGVDAWCARIAPPPAPSSRLPD
ncbi:protein tyrosine phosphatase [Burkholderia sp. MSh2]|uniref:protein-tyrosine-phosphatase n=1 Tax=Burkholderia paludis TaxID=1506587 RepID=A0A6J5DP22_9BURK|nr:MULTISPECIES: low molecular weight protein-tyrosine-phosphatase [Burkholderia]KEZ07465.1 protein tyrosine phosphatase [Burkholderia sp. MSh2]CAB3755999.1 Low molecular weight protein-tyrosine-phosphatase Ptp [Burkholderia paludis]VWB59853.1 protein-tyrosine-phosphatase [Burkholderia paludis]